MSMLKSSLDETLMAMLCLHVMCPQQHSSCALHAMYRFRSTHITCYCTLDQSGFGLFVSNRTTYKQCILDRYISEIQSVTITTYHQLLKLGKQSVVFLVLPSTILHMLFYEFYEDVKFKLSFVGKIQLT